MTSPKEIRDANTLGGRLHPVLGPAFSRRQLFELAGTGIAGYTFANLLSHPRRLEAATAHVLRSTARNAIFVFMAGGPSHSDTWDLKEGAWTPMPSGGEPHVPSERMKAIEEAAEMARRSRRRR